MLKVCAFLLASALGAADISGIWVGTIPGRNGEPLDISFQFKQAGGVLNGKLYGDYRSTAISEGKIEDDQVSFLVMAQEQAGNEILTTQLKFSGALKDGELELTRERVSAVTAGSGTKMVLRNNNPVLFRLKRLLYSFGNRGG